jgi:hypothetical protein
MLPIRMTPKRREWLTKLRDEGPAKRTRGSIGYDCMQAGWAEWDYRLPGGTPISDFEARERFGDGWWERVIHDGGERITDAGRSALDEQETENRK